MSGFPIDISVVIVSWNVSELLRDCIGSLIREVSSLNYEIMVVDNASSDGTVAMVKKEFPQVRLIENQVNIGFPRANNQVIPDCRGEFILFLNPDTVVLPGSINAMRDFLLRNTEYGAVGPKITRPDGSIQVECASKFPTLWDMFCEMTFLSRIFSGNPLFGYWRMTYWDHEDSRDVECLLGAAILMRRSILGRIGLMDEHMYIEDEDLCYRILEDGWKIRYLSESGIVHFDGASRKSSVKFYHHYQIAWNGLWHLFRKHKGGGYAFLFRSMSFALSLSGLIILSFWLALGAALGRRPSFLAEKREKAKAVLMWSITPAARFRTNF